MDTLRVGDQENEDFGDQGSACGRLATGQGGIAGLAASGKPSIRTKGQAGDRPVQAVSELPAEYFQVTRVSLVDVPKIPDDLFGKLSVLNEPGFDNLEVMDQIGARPREVIAVGGGTRNPLWLQIVSDVCGVPQTVPEITLGAAYGDAFLAGLGAGAFASYQDIRAWTRAARTVVPNPAYAEQYRRSFELYLDLYRTNKSLMHRLTAQL